MKWSMNHSLQKKGPWNNVSKNGPKTNYLLKGWSRIYLVKSGTGLQKPTAPPLCDHEGLVLSMRREHKIVHVPTLVTALTKIKPSWWRRFTFRIHFSHHRNTLKSELGNAVETMSSRRVELEIVTSGPLYY